MALVPDTTITWFGHSCWEIGTPGGQTILLDPWFSNPSSPKAPDAVDRCDLMLVTHGHFDHFGDALPIAQPDAAGLAVHPRAEPVARPELRPQGRGSSG